jgi:hypothetical protein
LSSHRFAFFLPTFLCLLYTDFIWSAISYSISGSGTFTPGRLDNDRTYYSLGNILRQTYAAAGDRFTYAGRKSDAEQDIAERYDNSVPSVRSLPADATTSNIGSCAQANRRNFSCRGKPLAL